MILCETMLLFFVYFLNFILQLISSKNNGFQIVQKNDKTKNKSHKWKNKLCTEVTCQCFANMTIIYFWELCDRN